MAILGLKSNMSRRFTGRRRICNLFILVFVLATVFIYLFVDHVLNAEDVVDDDVMLVIRETKEQKEYINKKGVHVIVGQYVGRGSGSWDGSPNLTRETLNSNNYSPIPKAGEMGLPVYVPEFETNHMKVLYHVNKFNLMASDRISVNRSLPDPRKERNKIYELKELGDASVIIVFHNEAWSTLLRTVHSVINRTPRAILKELVLVDDYSERKFLGKDLSDYLALLTTSSRIPIKLIRASNRTGLVRARLLGAEVAAGQVLAFLDAHCEVTIGWLEPLLARIAGDRRRVVCPVIDIIHDETFAYARSFELHWGGINWNLHFRWYPLGQKELLKNRQLSKDDTLPFRTPIMAGGLFAINKKYFYQIGSYDPYMDIWGGENIEMSLRIWQCGGRVEIAPCSHVAHLFRKSSPYTFPRKGGVSGVLYTNLARMAEVWMDDYKSFFYKINPVAMKTIYGDAKADPGSSLNHLTLENIDERVRLRNKLDCRSFKWFLDNIWPEHFFPTEDRFFGQIKNAEAGECIQRPNSKGGLSNQPVGKVELEPCAIEVYAPQCFVYTKKGYIMTDESVCLDVSDPSAGTAVFLIACSEFKRQKWKYDPTSKSISHVQSALCLDLRTRKELTLNPCSASSYGQRWEMVSVDWH